MTEHSVAAPEIVREPAAYGSRLLAAVFAALLLMVAGDVIVSAWVFFAEPTHPDFPTLMTVLMWAVPALYVLASAPIGATIGMASLGLRVTGADGSERSRLRLLGRGVLLFAIVGVIVVAATWWLLPLLLLLAYSLLMLVSPKCQLPHDLNAGTVLVGHAVPRASEDTLHQVRAQAVIQRSSLVLRPRGSCSSLPPRCPSVGSGSVPDGGRFETAEYLPRAVAALLVRRERIR